MKIETKYNIGDTIYFEGCKGVTLRKLKIKEVRVYKFRNLLEEEKIGIEYLDDNGTTVKERDAMNKEEAMNKF